MNQPTITPEKLNGTVEHVVFHNNENGFCVLKIAAKGHQDYVTVVGSVPNIAEGETFESTGKWITNKNYGLQFQAETLNVVAPQTSAGVEKYLASGMVKGIGPHFAKKLINAYGKEGFDVIENDPQRLLSLDGIGKKRGAQIIAAWDEQKVVRDIMVFLQAHGIGTARAVRIFKFYGDAAIEKVSDNPYQLALDVHGIGFKVADDLAQALGIDKNAPIRAQAGVRHSLRELCNNGHCTASVENIIKQAIRLLGIERSILKEAIEHEVACENLIAETINDVDSLYLPNLYNAEVGVAECLTHLLQTEVPWRAIDAAKVIPEITARTKMTLSESQQKALETIIEHKVSIITGGPGVGKTTIVNTLIKMLQGQSMGVKLCAPTGRAAKRMSEATGMIAKTIHRLLEFDPAIFDFKHNADDPLDLEVLIVEEASMLDISLMHRLLKAIPQHAALILVGDVDQLPSVGAGQVLANLIDSGVIPTVRLTEIFRQAKGSQIITNSHRINQGELPQSSNAESDFYVVYESSAEAIHNKIIQLVSERIPKKYQCDPISNIQVLTPMNKGGLGTKALNASLQALLNGDSEPKIQRFGITFSPGDKVIQTINNYDKEVFNGDIGMIDRIDENQNLLWIYFDNRSVEYEFSDLDQISLAYATSIHKSQGSEYPIIVMPLAMQHFALLARNLVYTGVTRGKKLVILVAEKKALTMAVNRTESQKRLTYLAERLQNIKN
jgi:exodeoxyribonuclease V alpha subunit